MLLIQKLQEDGVLFEKEILSLLDKTFDKTSVEAHTQGSETATSYLKIGEMTTEANIQDFLKNFHLYNYNYKGESDKDKKHIGIVIGDNYNYSKEVTSIVSQRSSIKEVRFAMVEL